LIGLTELIQFGKGLELTRKMKNHLQAQGAKVNTKLGKSLLRAANTHTIESVYTAKTESFWVLKNGLMTTFLTKFWSRFGLIKTKNEVNKTMQIPKEFTGFIDQDKKRGK